MANRSKIHDLPDDELLAAIDAAPSVQSLVGDLRVAHQTLRRRVAASPRLGEAFDRLRVRRLRGVRPANYTIVKPAPNTQDEADALVREAFEDAATWAGGDLSRLSGRQITVLALAACYNVVGHLNLLRGWVRAFQVELEALGRPTSAPSVRWYKVEFCRHSANYLDTVDGMVPADLLEEITAKYWS